MLILLVCWHNYFKNIKTFYKVKMVLPIPSSTGSIALVSMKFSDISDH